MPGFEPGAGYIKITVSELERLETFEPLLEDNVQKEKNAVRQTMDILRHKHK